MTIKEALEALRKNYGCLTTTGCGSLGNLCDRCEYDVDADTVTEALKTVLDAFSNGSEIPNSSDCICRQADLIDRAAAQTELQFAARKYTVAHEAHGEGQVVWSDNLISVTDAMNALRKVTSVQAQQMDDTEFWKKRVKDYENTVNDLISKMTKGVKFNCMEMNAEGITFREEKPSVQAEQKWIPCSKRLPKNRDWYLGIFRESDTGWINIIPFVCSYIGRPTSTTTKDYWIIHGCTESDGYYKSLECVAWMPLPEPYRGDDK